MSRYLIIIFSVIVLNGISSSVDSVYARGGDKGYYLHNYENCRPDDLDCITRRMP
jgi:hypothetical protein